MSSPSIERLVVIGALSALVLSSPSVSQRSDQQQLVAQVLEIARANADPEEMDLRVRLYVDALSKEDRTSLARGLVRRPESQYRLYGAALLVRLGQEQEAAVPFGDYVTHGGDLTPFTWEWLHTGDVNTSVRMYIAISRQLLRVLDGLPPDERERAQAFLTLEGFGPSITKFSRAAVESRLAALERDIRHPAR